MSLLIMKDVYNSINFESFIIIFSYLFYSNFSVIIIVIHKRFNKTRIYQLYVFFLDDYYNVKKSSINYF